MPPWTALLLAGSRPEGDPFAESMGSIHKALIPVGGEPMVLRPLRALLSSPAIRHVRVASQSPEPVAAVIPADPRVSIARSQSTIAATLSALCKDPGTRFPVLVTTADHALLTPAMIAEFTAASRDCDIGVAFVESQPLLARFPNAQRTWLRFGSGKYSGANLFALNTPQAAVAIERWRSIEQDRKKGWRVLLQLGLPLFLGAVLRVHDIQQTAANLGRKLGIVIKPVVMSDPLAAIDVDKPADHVLVEEIIAGRA
ncbi:nucleotidyltransferase family protein [Sphingomonas sp. GCM10030256]|uniref:nucleotidyltransferase family protein n=1 Tax=Sphingomonas sp. GCM10030256 TaxID=3273427 RepID=UPI0036153B27